jgi:hypothetical protein
VAGCFSQRANTGFGNTGNTSDLRVGTATLAVVPLPAGNRPGSLRRPPGPLYLIMDCCCSRGRSPFRSVPSPGGYPSQVPQEPSRPSAMAAQDSNVPRRPSSPHSLHGSSSKLDPATLSTGSSSFKPRPASCRVVFRQIVESGFWKLSEIVGNSRQILAFGFPKLSVFKFADRIFAAAVGQFSVRAPLVNRRGRGSPPVAAASKTTKKIQVRLYEPSGQIRFVLVVCRG